ncbi:hypothetical protein I79_006387 [Cricetulus griseus]|uniref:Uncharacterized protein n=1 Tax=Cricetulus griseus TaxID=10029 RepID=G3H7Q1_CRIGR|nr:hypothetical protein I79_006387 [Cricetulus griseus]
MQGTTGTKELGPVKAIVLGTPTCPSRKQVLGNPGVKSLCRCRVQKTVVLIYFTPSQSTAAKSLGAGHQPH